MYIDGLQLTIDVQTKSYNAEEKLSTRYTTMKSSSYTYGEFDDLTAINHNGFTYDEYGRITANKVGVSPIKRRVMICILIMNNILVGLLIFGYILYME